MARKEVPQNEQDIVRIFRRPVVPVKDVFLGKPHIDLYICPIDGGPPKRKTITKPEEELDAHIAQLDQEFERDLKIAMMLETAIFFFSANLFKKEPLNLEKAATQADLISIILTKQWYGSPKSHGYQNLLKEIGKIAQEGEGVITLMGWQSRLVLKKDPEGNQFLGIAPTSHKKVKTYFNTLAYILGFDNGSIPINDVSRWDYELKNWDIFYSELESANRV